MPFLTELRTRLARVKSIFRTRKSYADVLEIEIAEDIVADAASAQQEAARKAYAAEQADLEAARLLRESLADGKITVDEIPSLQAALRNVTRSAEHDHQITEVLA